MWLLYFITLTGAVVLADYPTVKECDTVAEIHNKDMHFRGVFVCKHSTRA